MNLFIITGITRGLGKDLGINIMKNKDFFWAISRSCPDEFKSYSNLKFSEGNLLDINFIEETTKEIESFDFSLYENVFLINNAGSLGSIKEINSINYKEFMNIFELNAIVPSILAKGVINNPTNDNKNIVNITTGAATRPIKEMGLYCSSKSALDMLTKIIAIENPHIKVIGVSPGMIETDMQKTLRNNGSEDNRSLYLEAKNNGNVRSSDFVANRLLSFILSRNYESGKIIHINDILP